MPRGAVVPHGGGVFGYTAVRTGVVLPQFRTRRKSRHEVSRGLGWVGLVGLGWVEFSSVELS